MSGNTITFDPANDFRAGETVYVTTTRGARAASGSTIRPAIVHQFTVAAGGAGYFSGGSNTTISTSPFSAAVGDIDGDGDLDVATASLVDNSVTTLRNDGTGALSTPATLSVGTGPVARGDGRREWRR